MTFASRNYRNNPIEIMSAGGLYLNGRSGFEIAAEPSAATTAGYNIKCSNAGAFEVNAPTILLNGNVTIPAGKTLSYTGGGGSDPNNYITNGDAGTDSSGWFTYADAAATTPVDGTGGTSALTFARIVDSSLFGTSVFLLNKTSSTNNQGHGVSYDFTIDAGCLNQTMKIEFFYKSLGSYADGYFGVYLYDKTNNSLITLAGINDIVAATTPLKWSATFNPNSTSTSYRLIFHTKTISTSTFEIYFDKVSVSLSPRALTIGSGTVNYPTTPNDGNGVLRLAGSTDHRIVLNDGSGNFSLYQNSYRDLAAGTYKFTAASVYAQKITATTGSFTVQTSNAQSVAAGDAITWQTAFQAAAATGNVTFSGNSQSQGIIINGGNSGYSGMQIVNGSSGKFIRVNGGSNTLEVVNSANTSVIASLTDTGALTAYSTFTAPAANISAGVSCASLSTNSITITNGYLGQTVYTYNGMVSSGSYVLNLPTPPIGSTVGFHVEVGNTTGMGSVTIATPPGGTYVMTYLSRTFTQASPMVPGMVTGTGATTGIIGGGSNLAYVSPGIGLYGSAAVAGSMTRIA